uniref:U5 small nuclear ribonucleoprotein TSSC4 n=1 Tax=Erpetoichthys calabaricus TaxID=27687 RepID=A0A8C4TEF8_ERPCA
MNDGKGNTQDAEIFPRENIEGILPDSISLSDSDSEDTTPNYGAEVENSSSDSSDGECLASDQALSKSGSAERVKKPFQLQGTSIGFSFRSKNIFDGLESAAKIKVPSLGDDNVVDGPFVRPLLPQAKKNTEPKYSHSVPDYVTHPERWTKYSLEGVSETSCRKNAMVAHEFIESLQKRQKEDEKESESRKSDHGRDDSKKKVELLHIENQQEESMHGSVERSQPELEIRKRKAEDEMAVETVGFHLGRKMNRKNIRRQESEEDED